MFHARPCIAAHLFTQLGLSEQMAQPCGQSFGITRWDKEAGFAIFNGEGDAAHGGTDDGSTASHRFQGRESKWFVPWCGYHHIPRTIIVTQIIGLPLAHETHMIDDTEFCRKSLQFTNFWCGNRVWLYCFTSHDYKLY